MVDYREEYLILEEESHMIFHENNILKETIQKLKLKIKQLKKEWKNGDTNNLFIKKAILKHGDLFDYSEVSYYNSQVKIIVICKKHGPFEVRPNNHLNGQGCVKCNTENRKTNKEINQKTNCKFDISFIKKGSILYDNEYDYSLVDYVNDTTRVDIICSKHNIFKQTPNIHLKGGGCPKCRESLINKEIYKNNKEKFKARYVAKKEKNKSINIVDDEISEEFNEFLKMFEK